MKKRFFLVVLAALVGVGCGSHGGSGGGGGQSIAPVSSAPPSGPDSTPPEVVVTSPARGAFLPPGPVHVTGHATDVGSGIATLTVNGSPVQLGATGDFDTFVNLEEGVAPIAVSATDKAGNRTDRTISVETGTYLPANQTVPEALAGRINAVGFPVIQKIAAAEIASLTSGIAAQLQAQNPIFSAATFDISIDQLSFGQPDLLLKVAPAGLGIQITIPQLVIEVTAKESVFGWAVKGGFTADLVTIQAAAVFGVLPSGGMDFQIPAAQATFQNFHLQLPSWISWLSFIAEPLMQNFLSSEIQKMLANQGAAAVRKIVDDQASLNLLGAPATFSYAMKTIGTDADGIYFDVGANLSLQPDPTFPASPGSLLTQGPPPASFTTQQTLVFSISQAFVNQVLHGLWQSGGLSVVVVPSKVAAAFGTALPFGATAQDLVSFFPVLQGKIPTKYLSAPVLYKIRSLLPPTATFVAGAPDPLKLTFGEYDITALIDTGATPLEVFTVSMHAQLQVGVAIKNGAMVPVMSSQKLPPVAADLINSPITPLGAAHLESYLDSILQVLIGGIVSNIPPIPLPSLPAGTTLASVNIHVDGTSNNWLTIEATVQ